ncbi:uncharacterized protein [Montipora capricornis]|uniref:uncharacterized protein n=1 Tax=Montipora capricornis TaxID=246305 RepID=UPI0035F1DF1B
MLAVSILGKKFGCDAQIEVADEIDGGGLKLNLRFREVYKKFITPQGTVVATLQVHLNGSCSNEVTRCKELLAFLKDQVLPKMSKLVSSKRLKKIKGDDKREGGNWFRRMWPSKTRKRKEEARNRTKSLTTARGYSSSDIGDFTQNGPCAIGASIERESAAGVLVTPRLTRPLLICKNENKCQTLKEYRKHTTNDKASRAKKMKICEEIGLQRVQIASSNSCGDVSDSGSLMGFSPLDSSIKGLGKDEDGKITKTNEKGKEEISGISPEEDLKSFAELYVDKLCKEALMHHANDCSKEFAKKYVEKVIDLARSRFIKEEKTDIRLKECHSEDQQNDIAGGCDSPTLNKLWKYSGVFSRETRESKQMNDCTKREKLGNDEDLNKREQVDFKNENDIKYEEFLEREIMNSLESNNEDSSILYSLNLESKSFDIGMIEKAGDFFPLRNNRESHEVRDLDEMKEVTKYGIQISNKRNCLTRYKESPRNLNSKTNEVESIAKGKINIDESGVGSKRDSLINRLDLEEVLGLVATKDTIPNGEVSRFLDDNSLSCKPDIWKNVEESTPENHIKNNFHHRRLYKRSGSESPRSERKQWNRLETGVENFRLHSTALPCMSAPSHVRSMSCPVVSEDDIMFESMLSHHRDVCDSLAKRTWVIMHVHELWNDGKAMDAIQSCIDLTGMDGVEQHVPYTQASRDYALFLNLLQQLPSSCSTWSLDLFVLLLPKLKGFISSLHHTSHVEMACGIIHVVLKKVDVVIRRTSKTMKNKDKELKLKVCTNELKEIKDMANDVIQTVKKSKRSNTEDLAAMKSALKELHLAIETFLNKCSGNYGVDE